MYDDKELLKDILAKDIISSMSTMQKEKLKEELVKYVIEFVDEAVDMKVDKKYNMKCFEYYSDVVKFLNNNKIAKEDIIAISPTTTSSHPYDNTVVLIWWGRKYA